MTDVRHMAAFRDVQVAEDFAAMAKQGYLDKEFTVYGCAYWTQDQRHYMMSSDCEKIYDFIENSAAKTLYPTPIRMLSKVCPVPMGQQENIMQDVKMQLAAQMQADYTESFFAHLQTLADLPANDQARPLLLAMQKNLIGLFSEEKLGLYEQLIHLAYRGKVLTDTSYHDLQDWLRHERANMDDDVCVKDLFQRTFYGFAYEDTQGRLHDISNARKENVQKRKAHLAETGLLVTPIFAKTYWYNYTYRLSDALDDYQHDLRQVFDADYINVVKALHALPTALDRATFDQILATVARSCTQPAQDALIAYARQWHL